MRTLVFMVGLVIVVGLIGVADDGSVPWPSEDPYGCALCQQGDGSLLSGDMYCYVLNCWCASIIRLCCAYWCCTAWDCFPVTQCSFVPWCDPDWELPCGVPEIVPL